MLSVILRQLRYRRWRAIVLASGILVASVTFSLLTASVTTSQARTSGTVQRNLRGAYDILVRPRGSQTALEQARGLVTDNYLSGIYGGITLRQYQRIKSLPGIAVAAPIAMAGYVLVTVSVPVDVTGVLPDSGSAVFKLTARFQADRGLSGYPSQAEGYVYLTANPLRQPLVPAMQSPGQITGSVETLPGGKHVIVCPATIGNPPQASPFAAANGLLNGGECVSQSGLARGADGGGLRPGQVTGYVSWSFPFLVAAIDPQAENELMRLGRAVSSGRYLRPSDGPVITGPGGSVATVPILASTVTYSGDQAQVTIERLPAAAVSLMRRGPAPAQLASALAGMSGIPVRQMTITAQQAYSGFLSQQIPGRPAGYRHALGLVDAYWTPGPVSYRAAGGVLAPDPAVNPDTVWTSLYNGNTGFVQAPAAAMEPGFRRLTEHLAGNQASSGPVASLQLVGTVDPGRLPGFSGLSAVPLETYYPPVAVGADPASRRALGGRPLLPDGNIAGYLQQPPLLLTTLPALQVLDNPGKYSGASPGAPVSVVRVRVADLRGSLGDRLRKLAAVAYEIRKATGLTVDITAGSSPTSMTLSLPAGKYGRPALLLAESWVRKGVALAILKAVDRKSVLLFLLILIVTGFFLANSTFATVRGRRGEIGVLRAVGWRRGAIFRLVLGEVLLLGLAAGLTGSAFSAALIEVLGLRLPLSRVLLVTPVAVVLAGLASIGPAWRAGAGDPLDAVIQVARIGRRARPVRSLTGMALANVRRAPGRAVLAAAALGVGVAAMTVLIAIDLTFTENIGGSALGGFITAQVRGVDFLSAGLAITLGAAAIADVTYLNLRERASELATLAATGWQRGQIARVLRTEAAVTSLAGAVTGAGCGLAAAAFAFGQLPAVLAAAAAATVIAVAVALAATQAVLSGQGRGPVSEALADEEGT